MKVKILFFLLANISFNLLAQQRSVPGAESSSEQVHIYGDFVADNYGLSPFREVIYSVQIDSFVRYRSLPLAEPNGWLTGVLVMADTARALQNIDLDISKYIINEGGIYSLRYKGIDIRFALEKAPQRIFDLIADVYINFPETKEIVSQIYRDNYLIRIYNAEHVFNTNSDTVNFQDVLLSATILGATEQPWWGIHDAYNLLERDLK